MCLSSSISHTCDGREKGGGELLVKETCPTMSHHLANQITSHLIIGDVGLVATERTADDRR